MSLTHFDPLASIRVFEDAFTRMVNEPRATRPWSPAVDIYETENELVLKADGKSFLRIVNPADSYQSSSDPRAHFGLGKAMEYDSIQVLWPDGLAEKFAGAKANQTVKLCRGRSIRAAKTSVPSAGTRKPISSLFAA